MYNWTYNDAFYARCRVNKTRWFWVVFDSFEDMIYSHATAYGYEKTVAAAESRAQQVAGPGARKTFAGHAAEFLQEWRQGTANRRATRLPPWCVALGLTKLPYGIDEVKSAYRRRAKASHPDAGGKAEDFMAIESAYRDALAYCQRCGLPLAS